MKDIFNTRSICYCILLIISVMTACSTEKNTFINRVYHSTTARYNGYFNAKELVRIGLKDYRNNAREDFTTILPIELLPNEEDVTDFYPVVDTAISKCKEVITKHSMPTASKPSRKKTEHANWIDKNWLMIGRSNYIRRDYEKALENFEYVRKFYVDRPSTYTGQLWEAKTLIQLGDITEAKRTLQKLKHRRVTVQNQENEKRSKSKIVRKSKSKDSEQKAPELPKHFLFDLAKVKAMLALEEKDYKTAIKELKKALAKVKDKEEEARLSFILGQLLQEEGKPEARKYYTQSIRKNAPFEMSFNAKINRAVVSNHGDQEMIEELEDLAKEDRYLEFRDQIYYAMAEIDLQRNDRAQAKSDLSQSVFYSLNNPLQKGVSYEKLGNLSFEEKDYVAAQKYYDSSAQVIPETYKNSEFIKNKADQLADLVDNIDLIAFEDSVQMIAKMDEKGRDQFLKDVIKQIKKEEQERKEREAARAAQLRELQQSYAEQNSKGGSKWYFSNVKAMQKGVEEFRRVWGQRENEDYWRLSEKPSRIQMDMAFNDSIPADSVNQDVEASDLEADKLTPEILLKDVPVSDSAMAESNLRLLKALYTSGIIYTQQLNEMELGATQFQRVIDHKVENKHNVMAAYQLYVINENGGNTTPYKNYILNNYPNSDYANYLRDPDYFVKKKERDALALKNYLRSVTRFEQGLYYPVILKADKVIEEEADNKFRKEYFLLKAMAMGQLNNDNSSILPVLEQVIEEYPETDVAERAIELKGLIENGVPAFEDFEITNTDMFSYGGKSFRILIVLKEEQEENQVLKNVSDFNREFHSLSRLTTKPQIYNKKITFVTVKDFESISEAKKYIRDFGKIRKYIADYHENDILFISKENYKVVMVKKQFSAYQKFFKSNF